MTYIIFYCPKCGEPRYCRLGYKTAKCFKCNYRIPIVKDGRLNPKVKIVKIVEDVKTAREIVKKLKVVRWKR